MRLAQGHNTVTPLRLEPAVPRSQVKHSTAEPLCSVGPQNAPLHNMLLLVAYCVPCIHNMLRWSILCTLHTQYATRGAYCVGSVHMLFQWSSEGTQNAHLENMSRGMSSWYGCLSF